MNEGVHLQSKCCGKSRTNIRNNKNKKVITGLNPNLSGLLRGSF